MTTVELWLRMTGKLSKSIDLPGFLVYFFYFFGLCGLCSLPFCVSFLIFLSLNAMQFLVMICFVVLFLFFPGDFNVKQPTTPTHWP